MRTATPAIVILGLFSLLVMPGCWSDSTPIGSKHPSLKKYRIVTTCGMVTDLVQHVAGERAEVIGLLGTGVDPHLYKPTSEDTGAIQDANLVFYCGLHLEGRMHETFKNVKAQGGKVFAVTEKLAEEPGFLRNPPEFSGFPDPHVWNDIAAWSRCLPFVAQCLAAHDPEHADEYSNNAKAYQAELESLETYVKETLATIPEPRRQLITAHDAFGYFSRAYNIPVHSVQGISTESEPGVNDINQLVDFIVTQKIPAIFVETGVNEANLRAVMEGAKSRGWNVQIGGRLYSDSMGPPGTYEGTYIGMIDHNTTVLARSLGGRASPGGWKGQLKLD